MAKELLITLLGGPGTTVSGETVTWLVSSKAHAPVLYLAATWQVHSRDALAGLLWSEVPDPAEAKGRRLAHFGVATQDRDGNPA